MGLLRTINGLVGSLAVYHPSSSLPLRGIWEPYWIGRYPYRSTPITSLMLGTVMGYMTVMVLGQPNHPFSRLFAPFNHGHSSEFDRSSPDHSFTTAFLTS